MTPHMPIELWERAISYRYGSKVTSRPGDTAIPVDFLTVCRWWKVSMSVTSICSWILNILRT
jgi:hypothetical protein